MASRGSLPQLTHLYNFLRLNQWTNQMNIVRILSNQKKILNESKKSTLSLWTSKRFLVSDQTNPIVENFWNTRPSALCSACFLFITSIKDIEKTKEIHRTTSELKFFGIYYLTVVFHIRKSPHSQSEICIMYPSEKIELVCL